MYIFVNNLRENWVKFDEATPSERRGVLEKLSAYFRSAGVQNVRIDADGRLVYRGPLEEILDSLEIEWAFWSDEPFDREEYRAYILAEN